MRNLSGPLKALFCSFTAFWYTFLDLLVFGGNYVYILDAFEMWCWRRLLRVPWTPRRSNQSILKEISCEYSLEELMFKLKPQYFGQLMWKMTHWRRSDAGKDWRQKEKKMAEDKMVRWHLWINKHEFEQTLVNREGEGSLVCCALWGLQVEHDLATEQQQMLTWLLASHVMSSQRKSQIPECWYCWWTENQFAKCTISTKSHTLFNSAGSDGWWCSVSWFLLFISLVDVITQVCGVVMASVRCLVLPELCGNVNVYIKQGCSEGDFL